MAQDMRSRREMLEDRLIDFTIAVNIMVEKLPKTYLGKTLANQLSRSSTSPALNYGEAQAAESTKDFIHKMRIGLKELRETMVGIKIINRASMFDNDLEILALKKEVNELISIYVTSIKTAIKRL